MVTLEDVVESAITVDNSVKPGNEVAKKELRECLRMERSQFTELAKDVRSDFMPGYDEKFSRIDMNVIVNATKKIDGKNVPAFAIYDVNGNGEYEISNTVNTSKNDKLIFQSSAEKLWFNVVKFFGKFCFPIADGDFYLRIIFGIVGTILNTVVQIVNWCNTSPLGLSTLFYINYACFTAILLWGIISYSIGDSGVSFVKKFTHKFSGKIPSEVRELVKTESRNFEVIYLVEEGYDWKIENSVETNRAPRNVDPLIIGRTRNKNRDLVYFLITKFDVTPLEALFAQEFTI